MSDQERVCLHGSLRRQCETCDLAARLEAAEAVIARLKAPPDQERLRAIAERLSDDWMINQEDGHWLLSLVARQAQEIQRLNAMRTHCEHCGADYLATGIEAGCPCRLAQEIQDLRAERDAAYGR